MYYLSSTLISFPSKEKNKYKKEHGHMTFHPAITKCLYSWLKSYWLAKNGIGAFAFVFLCLFS